RGPQGTGGRPRDRGHRIPHRPAPAAVPARDAPVPGARRGREREPGCRAGLPVLRPWPVLHRPRGGAHHGTGHALRLRYLARRARDRSQPGGRGRAETPAWRPREPGVGRRRRPAPAEPGLALAKPALTPAASSARLRLGDVPMILMYHGVADEAEDPNHLCVAPSRFAEQMTWLKRRGLRGVGIGTLVDEMRAGRAHGLVGITFDDGYVNVLEAALPERQRHGFTASMYIISGRLGGSNEWDEGPSWPLMSASQVGELAAAGMEIGSHGATHVRLAGLGADQLAAEVADSRTSLEE